MTRYAVPGLCLWFCTLTPVHGWWDNGHMLTAQVARLQLTDEQAALFDAILADWAPDFPGASDVVSSAVWPDLIKCTRPSSFCRTALPNAVDLFNSWHFTDLAYNPDNVSLTEMQKSVTTDKNPSSGWVLQQAMGTFNESKTRFAFNLMLRFVIHIVGDMHQPLHNAEGFFNDSRIGYLPGGSLGGNLIQIVAQNGAKMNLHAYWDSAALQYTLNWPLSEEQKTELKVNATKLTQMFPRSSFPNYRPDDVEDCWAPASQYCRATFGRWIQEHYQLAVQDAFGMGLVANQPLSQEYVDNAKKLSQQQIVLGGYRLGDLLMAVLPKLPPHQPQLLKGELSDSSSAVQSFPTLVIVLSVMCTVLLAAVFLLAALLCRQKRRRLDGLLLGEGHGNMNKVTELAASSSGAAV